MSQYLFLFLQNRRLGESLSLGTVGKTDATVMLLKLLCVKYTNMSVSFHMWHIFVGILLSWLALLASSLLISLKTSA